MLDTLTLNSKLQDRLYGENTTHKALMYELSDKKPQGFCGRNMTAKIEEFPAKK